MSLGRKSARKGDDARGLKSSLSHDDGKKLLAAVLASRN
jgi:hypothetical protein